MKRGKNVLVMVNGLENSKKMTQKNKLNDSLYK